MNFFEFIKKALFNWESLGFFKLLLGAGLSLLAKVVYDRYISDMRIPISKIYEDLDSGKSVSTTRMKRLNREADKNLEFWQRDLLPPSSGTKLKVWPNGNEAIYIRPLDAPPDESACPFEDEMSLNSLSPLFFHLNGNQIAYSSCTDRGVSNQEGKTDTLGGEITNELLQRDLYSEFEKKFEKLQGKYKLSESLIRCRNYSRKKRLRIWMLAPNILIRNQDECLELFSKLKEIANKWIGPTQIILEIYLSEDIKPYISKYIINSDESSRKNQRELNLSILNDAALYTLARKSAFEILYRGNVIGNLQIDDKHPVSIDILEERIRKYINIDEIIIENSNLTTISLTGPPGSGKTEMASLLIHNLTTKDQILALVISSAQLLEEIQGFDSQPDSKSAYTSFVDTLCSETQQNEFIPHTSKHERALWCTAFRDALLDILINKRRPVLIVVDDIQAYNRVNRAISMLRQQFSIWGLNFLLIGRRENNPIPGENFICIWCELWDYSQSKDIMKNWLQDEMHIENILKNGRRNKQEFFSLYHLRIFSKHKNALRIEPSVLLKNEIDKLLSPILKEMRTFRLQESPSTILEKIKVMLEENQNPAIILSEMGTNIEIDPVLLFGMIAWFSVFQERDGVLDSSKIENWTKEYSLNKEDAKILLEGGIIAKVFSGRGGLYLWHDPLVKEVCAALYLGHEVFNKKLDDTNIAKMVELLDESNSTDFLILSLDPQVLLKIIRAIIKTRKDLTGIVGKLITDGFIERLSEESELIDGIAMGFWNEALRGEASQVHIFALVLSKFFSNSKSLKKICEERVKEGTPPEEATLAVGIKAAILKDDIKYFDEMENNAPDFLYYVTVMMAARFWGPKLGLVIFEKIMKLYHDGADRGLLRQLWSFWCIRQSNHDIFSILENLINKFLQTSKEEDFFNIIIDESLKISIGERLPENRSQYCWYEKENSSNVNKLKKYAKKLTDKGSKIACKVIKWIIYFKVPDIVDKKSVWLVKKSGHCAIQKTDNGATYVAQILATISKLRNDYKLNFELCSKAEIRNYLIHPDGHVELVRDEFPKNFSYGNSDILLPVNLATWDSKSKKTGFVARENIKESKFFWRLKFNL